LQEKNLSGGKSRQPFFKMVNLSGAEFKKNDNRPGISA
jgi:hypothetical protein